jgi:DNA invertase Pin-like site-specific DNA recombinase
MLSDIRLGKFDTIICYKLDRLGRSLSNLIQLLQEFKNRGIRLISVQDGIDTKNDNPMSKAFWQLLGVFAELEREMIVSRVNDGLARARKNGKQLGRPFGSKDKKVRRKSGYHLRWTKVA